MLNIGNKNFMNLQEAVGWLLENNALPFQSTANYAGNTEIAMSTLINPSPAKVRVGSIIFFADSKVSTVIGVTSNSFIVSDQYNDLVDDVVYVSNVALNASGHLIVTLSNGDTIDAGLIKQVTGFSIDGSQHLIVSYNDSTTTDLGAIFSGNITISGNLTVTSGISGNAITGNSIIENMSGYSFSIRSAGLVNVTANVVYAGMVKNGNKLTLVLFASIRRTGASASLGSAFEFNMPNSVGNKIYPFTIGAYTNICDLKEVTLIGDTIADLHQVTMYLVKNTASQTTLSLSSRSLDSITDLNKDYLFRYECTFLLSDNLAS